MLDVTILSPHRDDAVFSLSIALSRWRKLPVRITVVNFFTRSEYAPRALSSRVASISSLRSTEDRAALAAIDRKIGVESLDLLDAPLRLGVGSNSVCDPETARLQASGEAERLAVYVRRYCNRGLLLAPLGLGNHVDHCAVNKAATAQPLNYRVGFYEDLPYATWTAEESLQAKLDELSREARLPLRPAIIRNGTYGVSEKVHLIQRYASQTTRCEARVMARYALRYRAGERIWIPKHGISWGLLLQ